MPAMQSAAVVAIGLCAMVVDCVYELLVRAEGEDVALAGAPFAGILWDASLLVFACTAFSIATLSKSTPFSVLSRAARSCVAVLLALGVSVFVWLKHWLGAEHVASDAKVLPMWRAASVLLCLAPLAQALVLVVPLHRLTVTHSEQSQPLLQDETSAAGVAHADESGGAQQKEEEQVALRRRALRKLAALCFPDIPLIGLAVVALVLAALANAAVPYLSGQAINAAAVDHSRTKMEFEVSRLMIAAALAGVGAGVRGSLFVLQGARLNARLREQLYEKLLRFEMGFFDRHRSGDLSSRLSNDCSRVADGLSLQANIFFRSIVNSMGVVVFMLSLSARLSLIALCTVALSLLVYHFYGDTFEELAKQAQDCLAEGNKETDETLANMRTVRAFFEEDNALSRFAQCMRKYLGRNKVQAQAYSGYAALLNFLPRVATGTTVLVGSYYVLNSQINSGELISFVLFQEELTDSLTGLSDVLTEISKAIGASMKIVEFLEREPEFQQHIRNGAIPERSHGHVQLENVTLRYPLRPNTKALSNISFEIAAGSMVALVGPSGGGKTSCVNALLRYYLPDAGSIILDGKDLSEYRTDWLRTHGISVVPQEPVLFARSIRENIALGLHERPSQEKIEEAAKAANAHDFISALPGGYDTEAGERGITLSGGQRQRICIARALLREPSVVILDEGTANLDNESEAQVVEALERNMTGRSTLVIAHRLSTVQRADTIHFVEHGTVKESGTHQALMEQQGRYYDLVQRQGGTDNQ